MKNYIKLFFLFLIIIITGCESNKIKKDNIYYFNEPFNEIGKEVTKFNDITDELVKYESNGIELNVVKRTFSNSDNAYFITINNTTNNDKSIELIIPFRMNSTVNFDDLKISKGFSTLVGYDKTTNPSLYIESKNSSILIGKSYSYNEKILEYDDKHKSIMFNLLSENNDIVTSKNEIKKQIIIKANSKIDTYFYYSNDKLFKNDAAIKKYKDMLVNNETAVWQRYSGKISKVQYSIEPFTREGYIHNIGSIFEKASFRYYDDSNYFKDVTDSSVISLMNYIPHTEEGLFLTIYTSTWVKKPYNIVAPYIDTRHNENVGKSLSDYGKKVNAQELENINLNYSNFLLNKYNKNKYLKLGKEAILFYDYYSIDGDEKTHASLNHQLAIANYLFESFLQTNNEEYYNLAKKVISGIEKIGKKWMRDNNDLWYEVTPELTFTGTDYPTVTFEDLLHTQELLTKIDKKKSATINILIKSKYKYIKNNNIKISNEILSKYESVVD